MKNRMGKTMFRMDDQSKICKIAHRKMKRNEMKRL